MQEMTSRTLVSLTSALGALLLAAPALAQAEPPASEPATTNPLTDRLDYGIVAAGKIGAGIGTGAGLGGTFILDLELGYALPVLDRSFEIFVGGTYTQPETSGEEIGPDPRLPPPSTFSYQVTQQELALTLGVIYRLDLGLEYLMPYAGVGPRIYLLNTQVKGDAGGTAFGQNEEQQTGAGFVALGGVDVFLGPGAVLGELSYGWSPVDSFVLRDTDVGQFNIAVGYRLML